MVSRNRVVCAWGLMVLLASAASAGDIAAQILDGQRLRGRGQYAEAEKIFTQLLKDADPGTRTAAVVMDHLALTYQGMGHYLDAEGMFAKSLVIWKKLDNAKLDEANVETHLAELYLEERKPADAEPLLMQAIDTLRAMPNPDKVALAVNMNVLAVVYAVQQKGDEGERLLREGLRLLEVELGPEHPMVVSSLTPLTGVLLAQHRYSDAVEPAERAWKILRSSAPHIGDPDLASALDALGLVYAHTGRITEAESVAKQAVDMAERVYGPQHPRTARYLKTYASILQQMNRKSEAKALVKRADGILAQSALDNPTQHTVRANSLR